MSLTDIAFDLQQGIILSNGDAAIVEGNASILQRIKIEAVTMYGDVFYDMGFGWGLQEFLHAPIDPMLKLEIQQRIKSKLAKYDDIDKSTVEILFKEKSDMLYIKIKFAVSKTEYSFILSLDRLSVEVRVIG